MAPKRHHRAPPTLSNARSMRLAIAVYSMCAVALLTEGVNASSSSLRLLRHESDRTTAGPIVAARDNANGSHVLTDETGDVWHILDGSHAVETEAATPMTATAAPPVSTTTTSPSASVELQEKLDHEAPSNATTTSSAEKEKEAAPAHHKTPMMGFVIIGAMAILCVGIAAGLAKRKKDHSRGPLDA